MRVRLILIALIMALFDPAVSAQACCVFYGPRFAEKVLQELEERPDVELPGETSRWFRTTIKNSSASELAAIQTTLYVECNKSVCSDRFLVAQKVVEQALQASEAHADHKVQFALAAMAIACAILGGLIGFVGQWILSARSTKRTDDILRELSRVVKQLERGQRGPPRFNRFRD